MATTLELLGMPQSTALPVMIQEALKPNFNVSDFVVASGTILANGDVRHMVTASPEKANEIGWPYQGSAGFRFHRMDLADFFSGINLRLKIDVGPNGLIDCDTHDVALELANIFDIVFAQSDYVIERIEGVPPVAYVLKASPTSLRWRGKVSTLLFPRYAG